MENLITALLSFILAPVGLIICLYGGTKNDNRGWVNVFALFGGGFCLLLGIAGIATSLHVGGKAIFAFLTSFF